VTFSTGSGLLSFRNGSTSSVTTGTTTAYKGKKRKNLPIGTSPHHIWLVPDSVCVTSFNCSVWVDMHTVHHLRMDLGGAEGCEKAFWFVDVGFEALADEDLAELNYPDTHSSAWDVFIAVHDLLSPDYK